MNLRDYLCGVLSLCWLHLLRADQRRLNEYITHYEELNYDTGSLHSNHIRAKRSTVNPYLHLEFQAHGRHFNLRLRRDTSTFSKDFVLESSGNVDISHIYEGEVWGEPKTRVHGSIIDGIFAGYITTPKDTYHVERADKYFPRTPLRFHSLIYKEKDVVDDPHRYKRTASWGGTCGNTDPKIAKYMAEVSQSAIEEPERVKREEPHEGNLYSEELNNRHRRATPDDKNDKKTCTLFLASDTMLWEHMIGTTKGLGYTKTRAREEITALFATHVAGIKDIYEDTVFETEDKKSYHTGISFEVRRIKINETDKSCPGRSASIACQNPYNYNVNPFCCRNIDVSNFLNFNSMMNHDDHCLAFVFTYRDFTQGTLGLAWVGAASKASGGICEKYKPYPEQGGRKIDKSLNTGVVTLLNYGKPVPPKVSTLTFAHEVGHNFGSPHDKQGDCTPFSKNPPDPNGNYIMFASATSGDRPNNSKFSPCSKNAIYQVLEAVFKTNYGKRNCFVARETAFCGNKIREAGEQCDCGYEGDCNDKCCHPRLHPKACMRRNVTCSPSEGPCCTENCELVQASAKLVCKAAGDCNGVSYCNGKVAACPAPEPKANLTACNGNTQVCYKGDCQGSICQQIGWEQCYVTLPKDSKQADKGKLCYVACQNPSLGNNKVCISTGDEDLLGKPENKLLKDLLRDLTVSSIKLPPGAPCDNFQGYCDVFQKCRSVDANGPLARLKNILFNRDTIIKVRDWIVIHWWAVLLGAVGLVVFMALFIKVCAVHTPSSNPKKRPARKISIRPQGQGRNRQQGPPPPYPGPHRGGPPHGKGRGPAKGDPYRVREQRL